MTTTVDIADLDMIRELILNGCVDTAIAAIDSIKSGPIRTDAASNAQTYYLRNLTGKDVRGWNLTRSEASRMIGELLETAETTHNGAKVITSSNGDKIRSKSQRKNSIPF